MSEHPTIDTWPVRDVFVGCHSRVWRTLSASIGVTGRAHVAIGYRDVKAFSFTITDRVWILSYSRTPSENSALLDNLRHSSAHEIIYVSSSSTVVSEVTSCYEYPRVKLLAEFDALTLPNAKVLTIGMMYRQSDQLPGGATVATSFDELATFIAAPHWPDDSERRKRLFRIIRQPFVNAFEHWAYHQYSRLIRMAGSRPCLLRPLDLLVRSFGGRWYGYVHLSNTLWTSTIS